LKMGRPLYQAIEKAVHASGELAIEGLKLVFREGEGQATHVTVEEFDEETKAFLVKEHGETESKSRIVSPHVFKLGMLASLPSAEMGKFLAAWDAHVEPLLRGTQKKGPTKEKETRQVSRERRGDEVQSKHGSDKREAERPRRSSLEKTYHSATSKGKKRAFSEELPTRSGEEGRKMASQFRSKHSEQGETSGARVKIRKKRRSGGHFHFPEGIETMEDFVAYLQPKLGQLPSNPVLVADVERRYSNVDQAKKGLYQTTGLLIRVYKAPQEWHRFSSWGWCMACSS
jgi:hypothetical protein